MLLFLILNLDEQVFRIAEKLRCLVCAGETVAYSQSDLARDMRLKIREMLSQGKTEEEILNYFVSIYGEEVLAEPPKKGFTSLVWMIPMIVVVLSLLGLAIYQISARKEFERLKQRLEEET